MHGADRYEAARRFHMLVENLERKARGLEGGARTVDQKGLSIFAPEDPCGMLKPMTTTMTSGDILINILIVFGCAFVLWLLQKCTSVIADYFVQPLDVVQIKTNFFVREQASKLQVRFF